MSGNIFNNCKIIKIPNLSSAPNPQGCLVSSVTAQIKLFLSIIFLGILRLCISSICAIKQGYVLGEVVFFVINRFPTLSILY